MTVEMMDQCPNCRHNLGRHCFDNDMRAGDEVTCPECGSRWLIEEHTDGWSDWFEFDPVPDRGRRTADEYVNREVL